MDYGTIAYWMYGLQNDASHYLIFCVILVGTVFAGAGIMMMFSAAAKNLEEGNLLSTMFLLLFMLFDGNWISLDKVPIYWRWVNGVSFLGYASQAATANEYRGLIFTCSQEIINAGNCQDVNGLNGEQILFDRGIEDVDITFNIIMVFVLGLVYRIVAFFFFWILYRNHPPKQIVKQREQAML